MTPTYCAKVAPDGRLVCRCDELAGKLVVIRERKAQRSTEANAWLWGVALPILAEHCGYDEHEHELLHYEMLAKRFGTVNCHEGVVLPKRTSSKMTTAEFHDYMEWFCRVAAQEFGVVIPLPNEPPQEHP